MFKFNVTFMVRDKCVKCFVPLSKHSNGKDCNLGNEIVHYVKKIKHNFGLKVGNR